MICPSCGTPNRDDAKFCKKCGHSLRAEPAKAAGAASVNQVSQVAIPGQESSSPEEDISSAPTQVITQEQMMAMQARRWQHELEQEQQQAGVEGTNGQITANDSTIASQAPSPSPAEAEPAAAADIADIPTASMEPAGNNAPASVSQSQPAADTVDEEVSTPPPPSSEVESTEVSAESATGAPEPEAASTESGEEEAQAIDEAPADVSQAPAPIAGETPAPSEPKEASEAEQPPSEQPEEAPPAGDFPVLAVGTTVNGRYEVTQVVSEEPGEHVYLVVDHQGYQRCWNCGSEENREGDEFCVDCGAGLLNAPYTMHEYPSSQNTNAEAEAQVLHEKIVNTFIDQGRTYVITQVQAVESAFPNGVHLQAASASDAGNVRRSDPNEDSTLVLMLQRIHESHSSPVGLFIVADGMGGHANGQLASRLAISTIAQRMVNELLTKPLTSENAGEAVNPLDEDALVSLLQGAVEDANAAICQVNQRDKTDMGSTITGFLVVDDYAYILNVGDSRTYMMRGGQIYQLTNDHSLVAQLVAGGLIQPEDIYTHPQRSQIFRSLGDKLNVQVDIFKQQLHPGDILLSCCDGVWEMVRDPQIESILNNAANPQAACTQLIEAANANGGEDNISAVVVFVQ